VAKPGFIEHACFLTFYIDVDALAALLECRKRSEIGFAG
jgi:hypothetical protein